MDNYRNDLKEIEERNGVLVNLILDYVIDKQMSVKELDECVDKVREIFYSDGLVRRS